jgi:uncharacterized protein (TIGR02266 family)
MTDQARRDKRYPAPHGVRVRCETWGEFVQHYATDISQGGMFIATEEPPELFSEIEVQLQLPEGHDVQLKASVVHVIDRAQAEREGKRPGAGLHFLELDRVLKEQIHQLVEFARWEGASGQTRATLASRMFEAAASLPPSKLLDALPPEPGQSQRATRSSSGVPDARQTSSSAPPSRRSGRASSSEASLVTGEVQTAKADGEPAAPPKSAADPSLIKLGMTHFARRRYEQAIKTFEQALSEAPGDRDAQAWVHRARASLAQKQGQDQAALEHYQKLLEVDENNLEARKFVREFHNKQRLAAIPFGRYFVKKP